VAKRIIPLIEEISLAYEPANKRRFIMKKEVKDMKYEELLKELEKCEEVALEKGEYIEGLLKDAKLSDEARAVVKLGLGIMATKADELPEGLFKDIAKVPEYKFVGVKVEKKEEKKEVEPLKKELEEAQKMIKEMQAELEKERDARRLGELITMVKDFGAPGDAEKTAKVLLTLEKTSEDAFEEMKKNLEAAGAALKAAGVFSEIGSSGAGTGADSAYERLRKAKDEILEKDKVSEDVAWERAVKQNPELYKEYLNSQN